MSLPRLPPTFQGPRQPSRAPAAMAEEALRSAAGGELSPRLQRAALVAAGGAALLALLLYTDAPSFLPGYPAVVVGFVIWAVAPGWLLQATLLGARPVGLPERLAVAFLCSLALSAPPGLVALRLNLGLETFGLLYALVASAASGLALLWRRDDIEAADEQPAPSRFAHAPLLLLVGVPLLAIATSPWWSGEEIARDADDWVYMAYVNEYLHADGLDAAAPTSGGGTYQRMLANVWVVVQSLIADSAGVQPHDLLLAYLPPLLTLFAAAASYTLARGLFRNTTLALMAVVFFLGYAALDLSPHEGFGRNVLLRIGEDKMVASFILLPVALLFVSTFISGQARADFVLSLLAALALFVVHPMALLFLGIATTAVAAFRTAVERSRTPARAGVALLVPLLVLGALSVAFLSQDGGDASGPFDPRLLFRRGFHIVRLTDDVSMGDYHLVLHPLMLAALALAPALWWRARRELGSQVVLAVALAALALFFVPPFATALGKGVSWNAVWRLPWLVPVALILARACFELVEWLARRRLPARAVRWALPATALVAVLAAALLVQEQYTRADGGAFYNRASSTALLRGTERSIVLGGVDRALSGDWRLTGSREAVIAYLRAHVPAGSRVLADPDVSVYLPGTLPDIDAVGALGTGSKAERDLVAALTTAPLTAMTEELRRNRVDYVIITEGSRADDELRSIGVYDADDFQPAGGQPELVTIGEGAERAGAWALDAGERERLGGATFTVPEDISPRDRRLDFEILVAPSQDVDGDQAVTVVVSYQRVDVDGDAASKVLNAVTDVRLPDGTLAGWGVARSRQPGTLFVPGATYSFSFGRLADMPVDTYGADLWFIALRVKYQPVGLERVADTPYQLLKVRE